VKQSPINGVFVDIESYLHARRVGCWIWTRCWSVGRWVSCRWRCGCSRSVRCY